MEINISYVVGESNRCMAVQIPYTEWKQLRQRLLEAKMQFWEVKSLEAEIRKIDLAKVLEEDQEIESGRLPAKTVADSFPTTAVTTKSLLPSPSWLLTVPSFCSKAASLLEKYPLLKQEMLSIAQEKLGSFALLLAMNTLALAG